VPRELRPEQDALKFVEQQRTRDDGDPLIDERADDGAQGATGRP
jgi:hypothetical protein